MHKLLQPLLILAIVALLAPGPAVFAQDSPQPPSAESVFLAHYEAANAGDLDGMLASISENIISIALPPPPGTDGVFVSQEAYRGLGSYLIGNNAEYKFTEIQATGDTLTFRALLTEDLFRSAGVFPIKFSGTAVVKDGVIASTTWVMDPYDDERLTAALTREGNKAVLLRAYDEVFNQGNFDVLEQDIAPDAIDHGMPDLQGVDAFKIPMMGLREALPDLQATVDLVIAEGDMVMALATFTGTHEAEFLGIPPSGEQVTWSHVDINRMENGQVVEAWHIGPPGVILEAMGTASSPSE